MWKFGRRAENERLDRLESQLRQLEGNFKAIELDWADVYEKVRRALGRVTKTAAVDRAAEQAPQDDVMTREAILQRARRANH